MIAMPDRTATLVRDHPVNVNTGNINALNTAHPSAGASA
jgi:hypothetical protein